MRCLGSLSAASRAHTYQIARRLFASRILESNAIFLHVLAIINTRVVASTRCCNLCLVFVLLAPGHALHSDSDSDSL